MTLTIHDETGRAWTLPLPERIARDLEAYRALSTMTRALKRAANMFESDRESLTALLPDGGAAVFDELIESARDLARAVDEHFDA